MMRFVSLVAIEFKNIFLKPLVIISFALIMVIGIVVPIIGVVKSNNRNNANSITSESVVVNGQTIHSDNPVYDDINELVTEQEDIEKAALAKKDDAALELIESVLEGYLVSAQNVSRHESYGGFISMLKSQAIIDKFVLTHTDEYSSMDIVYAMSFMGRSTDEKYIRSLYYDLDDEKRADKIRLVEDQLAMLYEFETNDDYKEYYRYRIVEVQMNINDWEQEIEAYEKDIFEHPENEEMYSEQIDAKQSNINRVKEIDIPILEYRVENDIRPFYADWKDSAVNDKSNAMSSLYYGMVTKEVFEESEYLRNEYRTYNAYKKEMQNFINLTTEKMLIADYSLKTEKPDMKYVYDGARNKTTSFLWISLVVSAFAAIIGAGMISKEYKEGTIRLLLIRPKTRIRVILSKFLVLIIGCFVIYLVSVALNILTNGIVYGFADYTYPNYSISSGIEGTAFFADYVSKFAMCLTTVFFSAAVAFSLSAVTKNTAVSVAVPLVLIAGSFVLTTYLMNGMDDVSSLKWIFKTPLPYINMFVYYIITDMWIDIHVYKLMGAAMTSGISILMLFIGIVSFKKGDVKN